MIKTKLLYNPLSEDFTATYDVKGTGEPETFVLKAMEIGRFPDYIAEHIKKHLADKILFSSGVALTNYDKQVEEIKKTLDVELDKGEANGN